MKVTNTTNSTLSFYTSLDPSHISRLRRGQRSATKNEIYIKSMAAYFSRHCSETYQRKILFDALGLISDFSHNSKLSEYIYQWLSDEKSIGIKTIDHFLGKFANNMIQSEQNKSAQPKKAQDAYPDTEISVYYGPEGKRQAVLCFLSEVLAQSKPCALLLYSDEPTDWMTADRAFAANWASLMSQILAKGNKIKIIHTVSRNLDEMLNALEQWMPLYMTGMIEPYYYPKKRDGIFNRTLFIAPEISAVISDSVGNMINDAANLLFREKTAVAAFEQEFYQYLNLCRPLMRIFTSNNRDAYLNTLIEFEKEQSDSIIKTESLSLLTMPETVALSIISRIENINFDFSGFHKYRTGLLEQSISQKSFTEIICLPDAETVKSGKIRVALSVMLDGGAVYYTPEEFILHLENIVSLLNVYKNFHICLVTSDKDSGYMLYVREDLGAIVAKASAPPVVIAINEDNMTAAFWDFLKNTIVKKAYHKPNNESTANLLTEYIRQFN